MEQTFDLGKICSQEHKKYYRRGKDYCYLENIAYGKAPNMYTFVPLGKKNSKSFEIPFGENNAIRPSPIQVNEVYQYGFRKVRIIKIHTYVVSGIRRYAVSLVSTKTGESINVDLDRFLEVAEAIW
jgi:hypothetical protein